MPEEGGGLSKNNERSSSLERHCSRMINACQTDYNIEKDSTLRCGFNSTENDL
jgi:hypothetical protein